MPLTSSRPRLHYQLHGTRGPEVIMVMGFGMTGNIWKPQTDDLARDHRLLVFDHRGLGESPDPPGFPLRMTDLADDVLRLCDEVGFVQPHLVGVSMGGMVAQEAALRAPSRWRSATFIATHAGPSLGTIPRFAAFRHLVAQAIGDDDAKREATFGLLYTPEFVRDADPQVLADRVRAQLGRKIPIDVLLSQISAIAGHDTKDRLGSLPMPVLLVRPGRDVLVPPEGIDRLATAIPGAEVVRFDDAGHGVTFQKAPELNAVLRAFIAREDGRVEA